MDILWSASTTMRNPERTKSFLSTIKEVEGEIWNSETLIFDTIWTHFDKKNGEPLLAKIKSS